MYIWDLPNKRDLQVTTKMGSARTSQLEKVRPHIASHTLVHSSHLPNKHSYVLSEPARLLSRRDYREKMWWAGQSSRIEISTLLCVETMLRNYLHTESSVKFHHYHHVYEHRRHVVSSRIFAKTSFDKFRIQSGTRLFYVVTKRGSASFSHQTIFFHKIHKVV